MNTTTETIARPLTAAAFNEFIAEKKFMGSRCTQCGGVHLPPRAVCPECHSFEMEWVEMPFTGTLAGFTSIYIGPTFMNNQGFSRTNPYVTGIVELEGGQKMSARILGVDPKDPASIPVGAPLDLEFIETGEGEDRMVSLAFRLRENATI